MLEPIVKMKIKNNVKNNIFFELSADKSFKYNAKFKIKKTLNEDKTNL